MEEGLIGLLVLAVLAVPVLLVIALVMIGGLKRRVAALEEEVSDLQVQRADVHVPATPTLDELMRARATPAAVAEPQQTPLRPSPAPAAATFEPTPAAASAAPPPLPPRPVAPRPPARPDPLTVAARAVRRWFTEGNVPVKVGMLVLFAGVAALLKFASDQGYLRLPIELRMSGIALGALAGLVFGWRQRESKRSFALSLQGGAIGVLLLVVFAAFKLYHLIPAGAAFGLSVVLVAGLGVLAVKQEALALAVFGVLAGFLAPIWLSTGQGNHVALFGYYAVLNAGVFAIAWWRPWRILNLLGFVFTFGIGTVWGVLRYRAENFASTEPFLLLFFAFYLLIPILYAWRRAAGRKDFVDGCLVFGTPLIAFSLQAGLLEGERLPLAFCALAAGAIYAALAWWLRKREHFAALVAPYAVLGIGFATLAVPLALSAHATASVFALEGAALVWLGLRQHSRFQQASGALLQLGAAVAFVFGTVDAVAPTQAIANARFMGALLIAVAGLASAWACARARTRVALLYYLWGLAWWIGNGLSEIQTFAAFETRADIVLAFFTVTGWLAAEVHRRAPAPALAWTTAFALASAFLSAFEQNAAHVQPFLGWGSAAWLAYAALGWRSLQCLREEFPRKDGAHALGVAHSAWLWSWSLALSLLLHDLGTRAELGLGWLFAMVALPWLLTAAAVQWRPQLIGMPVQERFAQWRMPLQWSLIALLAFGMVYALLSPGASTPLPWLPLLNPLDLAQLAAFAIAAKWLASDLAPSELRQRRIPILAVVAFAMVSVITLRGAHHWGGVPWSDAMFRTSLVQTSLTLVWSVLGVLGWIIGSRRGQRTLWLAGAVLMGVVLAKLLLVDRGHLGNIFGIVSFIAYGLLCTAVGYFAPAPPRAASSSLGEAT